MIVSPHFIFNVLLRVLCCILHVSVVELSTFCDHPVQDLETLRCV